MVVPALVAGLIGPSVASAADPPSKAQRRTISGPSNSRPTRPATAAPAPADAIVVKFRPGAARSAIRKTERIQKLKDVRGLGVEVVRPNGRSLADTLVSLRKRADVVYAEPDVRRTPSIDPTTEPFFPSQWGLHNTGQTIQGFPGIDNVDIDAAQAFGITQGDPGLVVAVIDDGVDFSHPDLVGQAWFNPGEIADGIDNDANGFIDDVNGWDFCNGDATVHDVDEDSHGTAVASTIAAAANGEGITGVAPGVRIMALKFIDEVDDSGCGTVSQEAAAIAYAKSFGIRIANASYGGPDGSQLEKDAIDGSGMLFIAAAGNDGIDIDVAPVYPAAYTSTNLIAVAGMHNGGALSDFSNYGDVAVDVAAPGEDILVAIPATSSEPADWGFASGTSFAAPHVSGVAALLGSVRTDLLAQPTLLRQRVLDTTWGTLPGLLGTGVVDALYALDAPTATAPSGAILAPATLGTSTATVRVSWPAATDDDGVAGYQLQQRVNGGAWSTVATVATAGASNRNLTVGSTYQFRVVVDDTGDSAVAVAGPPIRVLRYQETSSAVAYRGTWFRYSASSASGGRTKIHVPAWQLGSLQLHRSRCGVGRAQEPDEGKRLRLHRRDPGQDRIPLLVHESITTGRLLEDLGHGGRPLDPRVRPRHARSSSGRHRRVPDPALTET